MTSFVAPPPSYTYLRGFRTQNQPPISWTQSKAFRQPLKASAPSVLPRLCLAAADQKGGGWYQEDGSSREDLLKLFQERMQGALF
jgi:hypothetical protein